MPPLRLRPDSVQTSDGHPGRPAGLTSYKSYVIVGTTIYLGSKRGNSQRPAPSGSGLACSLNTGICRPDDYSYTKGETAFSPYRSFYAVFYSNERSRTKRLSGIPYNADQT